jgi:predicted RecA/RadA family phage recombinase
MATNYVQPGDVMTFTAPTGGVTSGTPVLIGNLLVIPQSTVAQTLPFAGAVVGVFTLPKATGTAWTEGCLLYWAPATSNITTVSTSNYRVGCAAAAAASGDTSGQVRLTGAPVPTGA